MNNKTAISILQELMVQRKLALPNYIVIDISSHTNVLFQCTCKVNGIEQTAIASNKKDAKQQSAQKVLKLLGYDQDVHISSFVAITVQQSSPKTQALVNYVGKLNEFASMQHAQYPSYDDSIIPIGGQFVVQCSFMNLVSKGFGANKKDAKQSAAKSMLERVKTISPEDIIKMTTYVFPKAKENDAEQINYTVNMYQKLSISEQHRAYEHSNIEIIPQLNENLTSEKLIEYFQKHDIKYEIDIFQSNPLVLSLKIPKHNIVLMEQGTSRRDIERELMATAVKLFETGSSTH